MKNNMPLMVSSAFFALFLLREGGQNYTTVERHPCTQLLDFLWLRLEALFLLPSTTLAGKRALSGPETTNMPNCIPHSLVVFAEFCMQACHSDFSAFVAHGDGMNCCCLRRPIAKYALSAVAKKGGSVEWGNGR